MGRAVSGETKGIMAGACAALIWSTWPVVSKFGVERSLNPYDMAALRFAVAGLLLLPVVWRHGTRGVGWPVALLLVCGAGAPYMLVMMTGLTFAPVAHAGIIGPSGSLFFSLLGGWLLLADRPDRHRLAGVVIIIAGVALVGWRSFASGEEIGQTWFGDLLFATGGLLWASFNIATRRWRVEPLHATALVAVLSAVLYLPPYAALAGAQLLQAPVAELVLQGVYQGLFTGVLGLVFHTKAVSALGVSRAALFPAFVPGTTVLLAYPVLGERPSAFEFAGVATVTFGMVVALGLHRRPRGETDGASALE